MKIIVRAAGERTEKECIRLAEKQGEVEVIRAVPFGESIRQTYFKAIEFEQEWTPVIDADVLMFDDTLRIAIDELNSISDKENIFCLDGKTDDKIFCRNRRAGIHIYKTELLPDALEFIDSNHIKPESNVRRLMAGLGFRTHTGMIVFGKHDYEQYYRDLWRKSVCQVYKLNGFIRKYGMIKKWDKLQHDDIDFKVILEANKYGQSVKNVVIDCTKDYGSKEGLEKIGLIEKGEL